MDFYMATKNNEMARHMTGVDYNCLFLHILVLSIMLPFVPIQARLIGCEDISQEFGCVCFPEKQNSYQKETVTDCLRGLYNCRVTKRKDSEMLLCEEDDSSGGLASFKLKRRLDCLFGFLQVAQKNRWLSSDKINIIKDRLAKVYGKKYTTYWNGRFYVYYYEWSGNIGALRQTTVVCEREAGKDYPKYYAKWNRERIKTCQERLTIYNTYCKTILKAEDPRLTNFRTWAPESVGVVSARNVDNLEYYVVFYEKKAGNEFQEYLEEWRRGVYAQP